MHDVEIVLVVVDGAEYQQNYFAEFDLWRSLPSQFLYPYALWSENQLVKETRSVQQHKHASMLHRWSIQEKRTQQTITLCKFGFDRFKRKTKRK